MSKHGADMAGKCVTLTKAKVDVLNELAIDSIIKSPLEINHTTMLGLLGDAFSIEWTRMHNTAGGDGYDEISTRYSMIAYLNKFWGGINGRSVFLGDANTDFLVFNQIHHSYHKMLEIMMSLPHVCDWDGNVNLLCSLIRLTGCLHTCDNENRCKQLKQILIAVCDQS